MGILKKFLLFEKHVCPWWLAYSWDHRLRKLIHNPHQIIKPYVSEGDVVADIGCGMGFFSIAMAEFVGSSGKVYAVDVQQKMLDVLKKRSQNYQNDLPINAVLAENVKAIIKESVDFILNFWMLHEVENKESFLKEWFSFLKEGGKYLLVEPKIHTSQKLFDEEVELCKRIGFVELESPHIRASRAVLFRKGTS
ncbi:MAG: class I SAM-dependent methyltransferase [Candidatus Marinimicrobia bacterium]|nr:class I SAM-dependent methyltransferase [Candidatus Neomarinimicrobiota bacterium]